MAMLRAVELSLACLHPAGSQAALFTRARLGRLARAWQEAHRASFLTWLIELDWETQDEVRRDIEFREEQEERDSHLGMRFFLGIPATPELEWYPPPVRI